MIIIVLMGTHPFVILGLLLSRRISKATTSKDLEELLMNAPSASRMMRFLRKIIQMCAS